MKTTVKSLTISLVSLLIYNFDSIAQSSNEGCIVKVNSEWAVPVGSCINSNNTYKAYFVNQCGKSVDIKLAIQEKSNRWRVFNHLNIAPGDTVSGYACDGSGKFVTWSRPTGNKSIVFPTDDEINRDYK
ncbi:MAG: hypothetical protein ACKOX7_10045 [Bacteroidota bacterium]